MAFQDYRKKITDALSGKKTTVESVQKEAGPQITKASISPLASFTNKQEQGQQVPSDTSASIFAKLQPKYPNTTISSATPEQTAQIKQEEEKLAREQAGRAVKQYSSTESTSANEPGQEQPTTEGRTIGYASNQSTKMGQSFQNMAAFIRDNILKPSEEKTAQAGENLQTKPYKGLLKEGQYMADKGQAFVYGLFDGVQNALDKIGKFNQEQGKYEALGSVAKVEKPDIINGLVGASEMIGYLFPGTYAVMGLAGTIPGGEKILATLGEGVKRGGEQIVSLMENTNVLSTEGMSQKEREDLAIEMGGLATLMMGYLKIPKSKSLRPVTNLPGGWEKIKSSYDVLGIKPGEDVTKAFREQALKLHPDRPGGDINKFQTANEAYQLLKQYEAEQMKLNIDAMTPEQKQDVATKVNEVYQQKKQIEGQMKENVQNVVPKKIEEPTPNVVQPVKISRPGIEPQILEQAQKQIEEYKTNPTDTAQYSKSIMKENEAEMPEEYQDAVKTAEEIIKLTDKYDLPVEARPKNISKIDEASLSKQEQKLLELQRQLEDQTRATNMDIDPDKLLDEVQTNRLSKSLDTGPLIATQVDDFIVRGIYPSNQKVIQLIDDYFAGKKVVYNKVDYAEIIDSAIKDRYTLKQTDSTLPREKKTSDKSQTDLAQQFTDIGKKYDGNVDVVDNKKVDQAPLITDEDKVIQDMIDIYDTKIKAAITKSAEGAGKTIKKGVEAAAIPQPQRKDIRQLFKKYSPKIIEQAFNNEKFRQSLNARQRTVLQEMYQKITNNRGGSKMVNKKGSGLTQEQKVAMVDMQGWQSIFKDESDLKINIPQLSKSIKAIGANLHIVNTPSGKRIQIEHSLMGNKAHTINQVIRPLVLDAIGQGRKVYIEPYAGGGTTLHIIDEYFSAGLEKAHINMFDTEKYVITKAMQDGKINGPEDIEARVESAFYTITQDMSTVLEEIDGLTELVSSVYSPGTAEYKQAVIDAGFYPELAPQYFKERMDAKLAQKGELTKTFEDRLEEKLTNEAEENGLKGEELKANVEQTKEALLNDTTLFEKNYPQISKKIGEVLDKFDKVTDNMTLDQAMLVMMSRHFRQRGSSGQKVVSATSGFTDVTNVIKKVTNAMNEKYEALQKHGDKIQLYTMDGGEFINKMALENPDPSKRVAYFDPPYLRTTGTYIKNNQEAAKFLEAYTKPDEVAQLFKPLIAADQTSIFTNDIDGKYFEALKNVMGERMSSDILGYREGTTPTSLVASSDISPTPVNLNLQYYALNRSKKAKDMITALEEGLLASITTDLQKPLMKLLEVIPDSAKRMVQENVKIYEQKQLAMARYEELVDSIKDVTSLSERQKILQEAKRFVKSGQLTGKGLVQSFNMINKLLIDRDMEIKTLQKKINRIMDSGMAETIKQQIMDMISQEGVVKKITAADREMIKKFEDLAEKEVNTPEELVYLADNEEAYYALKDKQGINEMTLEEISALSELIGYRENQGRALHEKYQAEYKQNIKDVAELIRTEYIPQEVPTKISQAIEGELFGINDFVSEYGMFKTIEQQIHRPFNKYEEKLDKVGNDLKNKIEEVEKKYKTKILAPSFTKIGYYGLAKRGDGKGKTSLFETIKFFGDQTKPRPRSQRVMEYLGVNRRKPMSDEEAKALMDKISDENYLTPAEKEMYTYMKDMLKEQIAPMIKKKMTKEGLIFQMVEDYWPIQGIDRSLYKGTATNEMDIGGIMYSAARGVEKGFTKAATGGKTLANVDALFVLHKHAKDALYYSIMETPIKVLQKSLEKVQNIGSEKLSVQEQVKTLAEDTKEKLMPEEIHRAIVKNIIEPAKEKWEGDKERSVFSKVINNVLGKNRDAILTFRVLTALMQPFALASLVHKTGRSGLSQGVKYAFTKHNGKYGYQEAYEKSPTIRLRQADGFQNIEGSGIIKAEDLAGNVYKKTKDDIRGLGYWMMTKGDQIAGSVAWSEGYSRAKKMGMTEDEAQMVGEYMVRQVIGGNNRKDQNRLVRRGGVFQVLYYLQSFVQLQGKNLLNSFLYGSEPNKKQPGAINPLLYGPGSAKRFAKNRTKAKKTFDSLATLANMMIIALAVEVTRDAFQEIKEEIETKVLGNTKDRNTTIDKFMAMYDGDETFGQFTKDIFKTSLTRSIGDNLPFISQMFPALIDGFQTRQGVGGLGELDKSFAKLGNKDKELATTMAGIIKGMMQLSGIPGSSVIMQQLDNIIKEDKSESRGGSSRSGGGSRYGGSR